MRELRPASVMQRKKMAQRNRPAVMVPNKIGILGGIEESDQFREQNHL